MTGLTGNTGDIYPANPVPCPSCGHCPTCGRGPSWPVYYGPQWGTVYYNTTDSMQGANPFGMIG